MEWCCCSANEVCSADAVLVLVFAVVVLLSLRLATLFPAVAIATDDGRYGVAVPTAAAVVGDVVRCSRYSPGVVFLLQMSRCCYHS